MSPIGDAMCDQLTVVAGDDDHATKLERAAAIIGNAAPEVTALVMLGLLGSLREYEDRFTIHESLLGRVAAGAIKDLDAYLVISCHSHCVRLLPVS